MKIFFRTIHLYLSLLAGFVILLSCLTGAVLVFEKELQETFNHNRYFVQPQEKYTLELEQLVKAVQVQVPHAKIISIKIDRNPTRTAELSYHIPERQQNEKKEADKKETKANRKIAFVNPYTAQIIELYSYRNTFFYQILALHRWLWAGATGKLIVGTSSLIFLFILITGIILWIPKTNKVVKQRLKIKWNANWKRLIHDFHIVLGFYTAIFLFIFAFTGLAWSFKWFNNGIYVVTNSSVEALKPPRSEIQSSKNKIDFDEVFKRIKAVTPDASSLTILAPQDSILTYTVNVLPINNIENAIDTYYIDQYTGRVLSIIKFSDKNLGQRVRSTFKPIHIASVYGIYSKSVGFIVCLLGATFPITGIIMWINRRGKNKKAGFK